MPKIFETVSTNFQGQVPVKFSSHWSCWCGYLIIRFPKMWYNTMQRGIVECRKKYPTKKKQNWDCLQLCNLLSHLTYLFSVALTSDFNILILILSVSGSGVHDSGYKIFGGKILTGVKINWWTLVILLTWHYVSIRGSIINCSVSHKCHFCWVLSYLLFFKFLIYIVSLLVN